MKGAGRQLRERAADNQQPRRVRKRERVEHEAVDDAEDRGVAADAEREREDGDRRKPGTPRQLAQRVAHVLPDRIHGSAPEKLFAARRQTLADRADDDVDGGVEGVADRSGSAAVSRQRPLGSDRRENLRAVAPPEVGAIGEQQQPPHADHVSPARRSRACARA